MYVFIRFNISHPIMAAFSFKDVTKHWAASQTKSDFCYFWWTRRLKSLIAKSNTPGFVWQLRDWYHKSHGSVSHQNHNCVDMFFFRVSCCFRDFRTPFSALSFSFSLFIRGIRGISWLILTPKRVPIFSLNWFRLKKRGSCGGGRKRFHIFFCTRIVLQNAVSMTNIQKLTSRVAFVMGDRSSEHGFFQLRVTFY